MAKQSHIKKLNDICFDKFGHIPHVIRKNEIIVITLPNKQSFTENCKTIAQATNKLAAKIIKEKFKNYKFKND